MGITGHGFLLFAFAAGHCGGGAGCCSCTHGDSLMLHNNDAWPDDACRQRACRRRVDDTLTTYLMSHAHGVRCGERFALRRIAWQPGWESSFLETKRL